MVYKKMNAIGSHSLKNNIVTEMPLPDFLQGLPIEFSPSKFSRSTKFLTMAEWQASTVAEAQRLHTQIRAQFSKQKTIGMVPVCKVKAFFFDMDATVIAEESLVEMAKEFGKAEDVHAITEKAMAGELDFKTALLQRVAMLAGAPESIVEKVSDRLTINRGLKKLVTICKDKGIPTFMISGGFTALANRVAHKVGFSGVHANQLEIIKGQLTGRVVGQIIDAQGKKEFLLSTCKSLSIDPLSVAAVGDGANDAPMLDAAGIAIGFSPKPALYPFLDMANFSEDHGCLIPLLFDGV